MATSDFIETATRGYKTAWDTRKAIMRLAAMPLFIKIISFLGITALGLSENYLRQGLLLLPSYFAEGWLIAHVIQFTLIKKPESGHRSNILAAAVIYVLTKLLVSFLSGLILTMQALPRPEQIPEPNSKIFFAGLVLFAVSIWAFRYMWLYIPVALGYPVKEFLKKIRGYMASVYMIAIWLLCITPFALLLMLFSEILLILFPSNGSGPSPAYLYTIVSVQAVTEMIISLVASLAIAYSVHTVFQEKKKKK